MGKGGVSRGAAAATMGLSGEKVRVCLLSS